LPERVLPNTLLLQSEGTWYRLMVAKKGEVMWYYHLGWLLILGVGYIMHYIDVSKLESRIYELEDELKLKNRSANFLR
jgi:hypothetical protein